MASKLILQIVSVQRFREHVGHIISGEFSDGREFGAGEVSKILFHKYGFRFSRVYLLRAINILVKSEKLCRVPKRKYKINKPVA
jgi:hypothetical protein